MENETKQVDDYISSIGTIMFTQSSASY